MELVRGKALSQRNYNAAKRCRALRKWINEDSSEFKVSKYEVMSKSTSGGWVVKTNAIDYDGNRYADVYDHVPAINTCYYIRVKIHGNRYLALFNGTIPTNNDPASMESLYSVSGPSHATGERTFRTTEGIVNVHFIEMKANSDQIQDERISLIPETAEHVLTIGDTVLISAYTYSNHV